MIYLDNAATTRITQPVLTEMLPYLTDQYGNPSTLYSLGQEAREAINIARERISNAINAEPSQIFFTSGATESNNWVLDVMQWRYQTHCSPFEHHSVSHFQIKNPISKLKTPEIVTQEWFDLIQQPTFLSWMTVNNETGEIFDIEDMCGMIHEHGGLFHTDATQAFGHIPIDVKKSDVDFLSLSGHKFHAPKGIGILYIKNPSEFSAMIYGGSQEKGLRAGTESVASIVGLGKAAQLYNYDKKVIDKIQILTAKIEREISMNIGFFKIASSEKPRIPTISSHLYAFLSGEALMLYLDAMGICVSSGSACNAGSLTPSDVLKAVGNIPDEYINGELRLSLSEETTEEEVDTVIKEIINGVNFLRRFNKT